MGLILWLGLLICAVVGYRAQRLKWTHGAAIFLITLPIVFVRFESAAKLLDAQGISREGLWGLEQFLQSWFTAAILWSLALLVGTWIGSRRRMKKALQTDLNESR